MQTILLNKQSTGGNPYAIYTLQVEPTNRTSTSVDLAFTLKGHLKYASSYLGNGYSLTGLIYINGSWNTFTIKAIRGTPWEGTAEHTINYTITGVQADASSTSLTDIKFKVTTNSGSSCTLTSTACDNIVIPLGHEKPLINSMSMVETNTKLVNAGLADNVLVPYLSVKQLTTNVTLYDNAKIDFYNINISNLNGDNTFEMPLIKTTDEDKPQDTGTFNFTTTADFFYYDYSNLYYTQDTDTKYYSYLEQTISDDLNGIKTTERVKYEVIPYYFPGTYSVGTNVKRNGQTTGLVYLNVNGSFYNATIGNVTNTPTIKYKFWCKTPATGVYESNKKYLSEYLLPLTEGIDYNDGDAITGTVYEGSEEFVPSGNIIINGESFKVTNYEIGSSTETDYNYFDPEKSYNVLIYDKDSFSGYGSTNVPMSIPVGESVWDEYKDRVNFKRITIKGNEVFAPAFINLSSANAPTFTSTNYEKLTLQQESQVGNLFELFYGDVVIGANTNTIRITGQVWFDAGFNAGDSIRAEIDKIDTNNTSTRVLISSARVYSASAYTTLTFEKIIAVSEGDKIELNVKNATGGRGKIDNDNTYTFVTIERVS